MLAIETLRNNATKFTKEFANSRYELGEAPNFVIEFCQIFGLNYRRAVSFERRVKKIPVIGDELTAFFQVNC
jgi:hypothetical protein